jgi:hypothetical protein
MSENLWGTLPEADTILHPKTILKEQATLLAQQTKGLLLGRVATERTELNTHLGEMTIEFSIICPALENYQFDVLRIYYDTVEVYPCNVVADFDTSKAIKVKGEVEMKSEIGKILQSAQVRKAIAALLRDAKK